MGNIIQGNKAMCNCIGGQCENKTRPFPCKTLSQQHDPSQSLVDIKEDSCLEGHQGPIFRGESTHKPLLNFT